MVNLFDIHCPLWTLNYCSTVLIYASFQYYLPKYYALLYILFDIYPVMDLNGYQIRM